MKSHDVLQMLLQSYSMELETVMNYLANSINLDGVRAEQIKSALASDIAEEVDHAQQLGRRIKQLGGALPGSENVDLGNQIQPPLESTDVVGAIKGVIAAEEAACEQYLRIIHATHRNDPVTADLCTRLLADEEEHFVLFRGFLKEYEQSHAGQALGDREETAENPAPASFHVTADEVSMVGLS